MNIQEHYLTKYVDRLIDLAFDEDVATGDLATQYILPINNMATARFTAKASGVVSGLEIVKRVIDRMGDNEFTPLVNDGDEVERGQDLLIIRASYNNLLSCERIMLNFFQRMSGIATMTRSMVRRIEGTRATLLDTRKTVPGHRVTDKLAVRHGGGANHRMGLYDMAMLKDNHIKAAGGIIPAVKALKNKLSIATKIEVETTNLTQVEEALKAGADIIMLDNMSYEMMSKAVNLVNGRAKTEASGNVNIETIADVAATGVDFISVGALTHSVKALDISMNFSIED